MASNIALVNEKSNTQSIKICHCKGIRTCLLCEHFKPNPYNDKLSLKYIYLICNNCGFPTKKCNVFLNSLSPFLCHGLTCTNPSKSEINLNNLDICGIILDGIKIVKDFLNEQEEFNIIQQIDSTEWKDSQSGRRKQNYGPKINFKRHKINIGNFNGLPNYSKFILDRINDLSDFTNYHPIELCNLEYEPSRGSAIDPHCDDKWIWGERLISISLLSHSILTFFSKDFSVQVIIPLKRRSFIGFWGSSRYEWLHGVQRKDIKNRRIAITFREINQSLLLDETTKDTAEKLVHIGGVFNGTPI